jgi:hypothetical protein
MIGSSEPTRPLLHSLAEGEVVQVHTRTPDALIAVTDRRLVVANDDRTLLDIGFPQLRRVQFDIERGRHATLVIVPEHVGDEPQVLTVPVDHLREVAEALALVGEKLNEVPVMAAEAESGPHLEASSQQP